MSSSIIVGTALVLALISSLTTPAIGTIGDAPAFFIFGDSTVDTGNNNYIETTPEYRADFKPYGRNGFFGEPTGRFSDGRVIVDFIAEYAGLPIIPAYKQPGADFSHGANFASGGGGVLPETNRGKVINLPTQLKGFEEVEKSLSDELGAEKVKEMLREAVYFISIGSNDYMGGYLGNPETRRRHRPEEFVGMVVGNLTDTIQDLYEKGARKFGFLSMGPLGCLPALRALNAAAASSGENAGGCLEEASALAQSHNNILKSILLSLSTIFRDLKYCNSDFYEWIDEKLKNPIKHGFKDGANACCGSGPFGGGYTCGGQRKSKDNELCEDSEGYIWFDSFHPTERIHEEYARVLWDGPSSLVGPYTLRQLFFGETIADYVDEEQDPLASLSK